MPLRPLGVRSHPLVRSAYDELHARARAGRKPEATIARRLDVVRRRVLSDALWGEVIPKSAIPEYFRERYGVTNLFCVDLPAFHRLFYTVEAQHVVMLDVVDHKQYEQLFGRR